jgi:hypothetical protein
MNFADFFMMKYLALFPVLTLGSLFFLSSLQADPSENGLEHRASEFSPTRAGGDDKSHAVPDTGSTIALLGLSCGALGLAYRRTRRPTIT